MPKQILVIYYSQTGQLGDMLKQFVIPFQKAGHSIDWVQVEPVTPYPFPWTGSTFFEQMPDCVHEVPRPIKPLQFQQQSYDLIILGYQAWFLSPSIPANSFLHDPAFTRLLPGTPVICLTGARNMWISAMERVKHYLKLNKANLVGSIAQYDKHPNLISFITIFHWMFNGRKDRLWGIFPKPGVADADIERCTSFGQMALPCLEQGHWSTLQTQYQGCEAIRVKYPLMFIETKAKHIFGIWAGIISTRKKRKAWLIAFKYYLIIAIFVAAPIILTVDALFFKPFRAQRIRKQLQYYSGVNYP